MNDDHVRVIHVGDTVVVEFLDQMIEDANCDAIKQQLFALTDSGHHRVVLDFSYVASISSVGVAMLIRTGQRIRQATGHAMIGPSPGKDGILGFSRNRERAVAAVNRDERIGGCVVLCSLRQGVREVFDVARS